MKPCCSNHVRNSIFSISFLLILGLFWGYPLCSAEKPEKEATLPGTVDIEKKGDSRIIINGNRYLVDKSTIIIDVDGKNITLCDLAVPCEAVVEYRSRENQEPVCLKIETKRLLKGASAMVIEDDSG